MGYAITLEKEELELLRNKTQNKQVIDALKIIDEENKWHSFLREHSIDTRIWTVLNSIVDNPCVHFVISSSRFYGNDIMGFQQKSYKYKRKVQYESCVELNEIKITHEGWKIIVPELQKALDILDIEFASSSSGLVCKKGEFASEEVWTDDDGYEYRQFDMGHGSSGFAGCCYPIFPIRKNEESIYSVWSRVLRLPKKIELVKVDGWKKCRYCGKPIRCFDV